MDWFTFDKYLLNGHYRPGAVSALRMQRSTRQTWTHSNTNIMTEKVQGSMGTQSSGNQPTLEEWIRAPNGCVAINLGPKEWKALCLEKIWGGTGLWGREGIPGRERSTCQVLGARMPQWVQGGTMEGLFAKDKLSLLKSILRLWNVNGWRDGGMNPARCVFWASSRRWYEGVAMCE